MALYHQWRGEYEESQALLKSLLEFDPLFFPARNNVADNLRQMGNPSAAIPELEKVLEQDPRNIPALVSTTFADWAMGNTAKARETLVSARQIEPRNYLLRLLWAVQLAIEGQRNAALRAMDADVLKYGELMTAASSVAEFHAVLGDRPKALEWLDRAVRAGDERASWFERDPLLANIRQEPRFREIVNGIRYRLERSRQNAR